MNCSNIIIYSSVYSPWLVGYLSRLVALVSKSKVPKGEQVICQVTDVMTPEIRCGTSVRVICIGR
jgi:hypothetical protein